MQWRSQTDETIKITFVYIVTDLSGNLFMVAGRKQFGQISIDQNDFTFETKWVETNGQIDTQRES